MDDTKQMSTKICDEKGEGGPFLFTNGKSAIPLKVKKRKKQGRKPTIDHRRGGRSFFVQKKMVTHSGMQHAHTNNGSGIPKTTAPISVTKPRHTGQYMESGLGFKQLSHCKGESSLHVRTTHDNHDENAHSL